MTNKEIETYESNLAVILADEKKEPGQRKKDLEKLAKKVGASTSRMVEGPFEETLSSRLQREEWLCSIIAGKKKQSSPGIEMKSRIENKITETEIVHNIKVALQTATMINMCKTASLNYKIALVAAIAAWVAVLAMVLIAALTS